MVKLLPHPLFADRSVAAMVEELSRRWPALGVAADHPLTEWLVHRHRRLDRGWRRFLPELVALATLLAAGLTQLPLVARSQWLIVLVLLGGLVVLFRRSLSGHHPLELPGRFDPRQPERLMDLKLTPVTAREVLAIHAAARLAELRQSRRLHETGVYWGLLVAVACWAYFLLTRLSFSQNPNLALVAVLASAFYAGSIIPIFSSGHIQVDLAIRRVIGQFTKLRSLPTRRRDDRIVSLPGPEGEYFRFLILLPIFFGMAYWLLGLTAAHITASLYLVLLGGLNLRSFHFGGERRLSDCYARHVETMRIIYADAMRTEGDRDDIPCPIENWSLPRA